jgi:hypothetical protein
MVFGIEIGKSFGVGMDYFSKAGTGLAMPPRYGSKSISMADCGASFMVSEIGGIGWGYGSAPKNLDRLSWLTLVQSGEASRKPIHSAFQSPGSSKPMLHDATRHMV